MSLKMVPFESFLFHSIVTIALSCSISEIKRGIGGKSWFFHTPSFDAPLSGSLWVYFHNFWYCKNSNVVATWWRKKFDDILSHFDRISVCDGQTDGRTDGQTSCNGIVVKASKHVFRWHVSLVCECCACDLALCLCCVQFNFVGRILGPRGMTAKQLEMDTGCKIMVRGKGSMRDKLKVSTCV